MSRTWIGLVVSLLLTGEAHAKKTPDKKPPERIESKSAESPPSAERSDFQEAVRLYQAAKFSQSVVVLDRLQREEPGVLAKEIRLYLGMNYMALGNIDRARKAFEGIIEIDPEYDLPPFTAPAVRTYFSEIKKTFKIIPKIAFTPPTSIDALKGATFTFGIHNMRPGYQAKIFFRAVGQRNYSQTDLTQVAPEQFKSQIPAALLVKDKGYTLEYYVQVSEGASTVLLSVRSPEHPFTTPVSVPIAAPEAPITRKWWFWTVIAGAVVVVAGGVTTAVLLTTAKKAQPNGDANVGFTF